MLPSICSILQFKIVHEINYVILLSNNYRFFVQNLPNFRLFFEQNKSISAIFLITFTNNLKKPFVESKESNANTIIDLYLPYII